jgi:muramoyltetrapeptide carboxypeptidase LdcA involved in peptidoglycan recycling
MKMIDFSVCVTSLAPENVSGPSIIDQLLRSGLCLVGGGLSTINQKDIFGSLSVEERVKSINRAAKDSRVVMAYNGGFSSIELMEKFDELKMNMTHTFIGYSDNTILVNALAAKNICRTIMGPMLAQYIQFPQFQQIWAANLMHLLNGDSVAFTDDYITHGCRVYRGGEMSGKVWGGNSYTFDLLQGTPYCPQFNEPFILLLEGEDCIRSSDFVLQDFVRNLDSISLLPGVRENIAGLLIGKFPASVAITELMISETFRRRAWLNKLPIVYDFPRGYGLPSLYLPIGENLTMDFSRSGLTTIKLKERKEYTVN